MTSRIALLITISLWSSWTQAEPVPVRVDRLPNGYRLLRNDQPYFIKGAGGQRYLKELKSTGGNSLRTWDVQNIAGVLDEAQKLGLTVTVGIWLGHERHGFDYSDQKMIAEQLDRVRKAILTYKDHPAVLMWGLGNEMEGDGRNPAVWKAVNELADVAKALDANHPTMTVIAGVGEEKLSQLKKYCPAIDVVGINQYGDLSSLPTAVKKQELDRPYILTEFGPTGWWQVAKTPWGEELEPTSTEKGTTYLAAYRAAVSSQQTACLGSYAFIWGNKQEHTRTWFGMFLPTGEPTAAVDAMHYAWKGSWPANRCPEIRSLQAGVSGKAQRDSLHAEHVHAPGTELAARVEAHDPDGGTMKVEWELRSASSDKREGGDKEAEPPNYPEAVIRAEGLSATIRLPATPGAYRLFVYVFDEKRNAATANLSILVERKR